jgi:HEAT repeat protein
MLAATPADTTRNLEERRSLIRAIGQSRDAAGVEALRGLTKEADARSRSDAWYYYVTKGGAATIPEALKAIASDGDESVRKRAVSAISQLPGDAGLPALLQLARATDNLVARKEAVSALSQSKDPRAIALMEEILKR